MYSLRCSSFAAASSIHEPGARPDYPGRWCVQPVDILNELVVEKRWHHTMVNTCSVGHTGPALPKTSKRFFALHICCYHEVLHVLHLLEVLADGRDIHELGALHEVNLEVLHVLHLLQALADGRDIHEPSFLLSLGPGRWCVCCGDEMQKG